MLRDVDLEYYYNNNHNVKNHPLLKVRGKKYQIWQLKTKTFCEILTENNTLISRAQQYWQNKAFNNPIDPNGLEWHHIWEFRLKSIKDIRLKNFNFKFLYNIVPVKSNLFKWKLSDDDLLHTSKAILNLPPQVFTSVHLFNKIVRSRFTISSPVFPNNWVKIHHRENKVR